MGKSGNSGVIIFYKKGKGRVRILRSVFEDSIIRRAQNPFRMIRTQAKERF